MFGFLSNVMIILSDDVIVERDVFAKMSSILYMRCEYNTCLKPFAVRDTGLIHQVLLLDVMQE